MPDDVLLNKVAIIERCLSRIHAEYDGREAGLREDLTRQDSVILNLQRACEASIDLAMHWIRCQGLGLPQDSRQAFALLEQAGWIDEQISAHMQSMVGFRNIAVHNYQALDLDIVHAIINHRLGDFTTFSQAALRWAHTVGDR